MAEPEHLKWSVPRLEETPREQWLVDLDSGTAIDATQLEGNPFERKAGWRSAFRATSSRAWAAAALSIAVLVLAFNLRPSGPAATGPVTSPDGTVHLTAADPSALKRQIVEELKTVGVDANGYEQVDSIGIDAELPRPLTQDVRRVLEKHAIPPPASGQLRVQLVKTT